MGIWICHIHSCDSDLHSPLRTKARQTFLKFHFLTEHTIGVGFPGGSEGKESVCNARALEDPLEEEIATPSSIPA